MSWRLTLPQGFYLYSRNLCKKSTYRVSHGKVNKVNWLCWGHRFCFLLIFWILHVHEIVPFMSSSSVLIQMMLFPLYRIVSNHTRIFFWKKSLNVPLYCKAIFNFFYFNILVFFILFGFPLLIQGRFVYIRWFATFYCLVFGVIDFLQKTNE